MQLIVSFSRRASIYYMFLRKSALDVLLIRAESI